MEPRAGGTVAPGNPPRLCWAMRSSLDSAFAPSPEGCTSSSPCSSSTSMRCARDAGPAALSPLSWLGSRVRGAAGTPPAPQTRPAARANSAGSPSSRLSRTSAVMRRTVGFQWGFPPRTRAARTGGRISGRTRGSLQNLEKLSLRHMDRTFSQRRQLSLAMQRTILGRTRGRIRRKSPTSMPLSSISNSCRSTTSFAVLLLNPSGQDDTRARTTWSMSPGWRSRYWTRQNTRGSW
mmetsp:Transcript_14816/g.43910  ORF Transcript_14816/g.43910 Transcript_14816/m.43910 type:complete len:235 (+) Transcript_14816:1822-2526(+)